MPRSSKCRTPKRLAVCVKYCDNIKVCIPQNELKKYKKHIKERDRKYAKS